MSRVSVECSKAIAAALDPPPDTRLKVRDFDIPIEAWSVRLKWLMTIALISIAALIIYFLRSYIFGHQKLQRQRRVRPKPLRQASNEPASWTSSALARNWKPSPRKRNNRSNLALRGEQIEILSDSQATGRTGRDELDQTSDAKVESYMKALYESYKLLLIKLDDEMKEVDEIHARRWSLRLPLRNEIEDTRTRLNAYRERTIAAGRYSDIPYVRPVRVRRQIRQRINRGVCCTCGDGSVKRLQRCEMCSHRRCPDCKDDDHLPPSRDYELWVKIDARGLPQTMHKIGPGLALVGSQEAYAIQTQEMDFFFEPDI